MEQVKSVHELVIKKDYRLGLSDSKLKFFEALPQRFSMKEARELGLKMDMTKDMVKKFVLKKDFFSRIGQKGSGIYEKIDFNDEDRIHL